MLSTKQKNNEYAFYMIMSSYFKKTTCKSPVYEKNLYLTYQELAEKQQLQLERSCISIIEKEIRPHRSVRWEDQEVDVYFRQTENDTPVIYFVGKGFHYEFTLTGNRSISVRTIEYNLFSSIGGMNLKPQKACFRF